MSHSSSGLFRNILEGTQPSVSNEAPIPMAAASASVSAFEAETEPRDTESSLPPEIMASCSSDGTIKIWDITTGTTITTLSDHGGPVYCVAFSPCGRFLASFGMCIIIIWDADSFTKLQTLRGHTDEGYTVRFNRTGDKLVSSSLDGSVRVWNLETYSEELKLITNTQRKVAAAFIAADSRIAVIGNGTPILENIVFLYDSHTGKFVGELNGHSAYLKSMYVSRCGAFLVSASTDGKAIIWDVETGRRAQELNHQARVVMHACFDGDASRVLTALIDGCCCMWSVATGDLLLTLQPLKGSARSCCFSEDGSKAIAGSNTGVIKVWDSYTGEELRTLNGHTSPITSVAYRPQACGSFI